ncbi:ribosome alternative rescue factor ArfA [Mannheimia sp. HC-2023]|uniref:alternative ribosome-rescue factor A n=1 Tax=Mannheimia indoligenes TaxID=3103145 RepID=UPI002FE5A8F7
MAKQNNGYLHQRGDIQESAVKALVTDPLFKIRVEKNSKGKGSYRRNEKHKKTLYVKGETPYKNIHSVYFYMGFLHYFKNRSM